MPIKKGQDLYGDYLRGLTPEERDQHFENRKLKAVKDKAIKQAWEETIAAQKEKWVALFNNRALELLENGNGADFATVFDRTIGKPTEHSKVDATVSSISVGFVDDK